MVPLIRHKISMYKGIAKGIIQGQKGANLSSISNEEVPDRLLP